MQIHRFARFALVGAAGFLVDIATLYGALAIGLGLYLGRAVSYLSAATFTWAVNRRFTFSTSASPSLAEWFRFVLANASGGLVNYITYAALVTWAAGLLAHPALAVACGSVAGLAVNYAASERFVFRKDQDSDVGHG
ncbi:GtrA family protein [Erythrobacter sp. MTPC3]|uniref:GtrA family protein n=1 Tax=Erythrobacter sp. MTPC3 TaxID=3056564 RepID=UPI0036F3B52D